MDINQAIQIIHDNYKCEGNSFIYYLHEKNTFDAEGFWAFYDSVVALVEREELKTSELTREITSVYQLILKYFMFHFDPADGYVIEGFPKEYIGYIERIEYALMAYYSGNMRLVIEDDFELKRWKIISEE